MAYQVLARKYRPRTFAEMAGQAHVLRALANGIANERLHHAYLFTGTRGVGKTTIARIFTKCLNCEGKGVTPEPCGECEACREIDQGRFVDLIEVDAASRTGVDDTRELLDNVQYTPTRGRYKIYLIDEVHMFSRHSFNALLKTLEEPPPHVKFLLATTDPQKLPVTILSRCLQFNLKHLPASLIRDHLTAILDREGIDAEVTAVERLARAADGSMRDALSLMDQALGFGGGSLADDDVRAMLGSLDGEFVLALLEALADEDAAALLEIVGRMAERAPDFGDAMAEMLAALHRLTVIQLAPASVDDGDPERERFAALAERLTPEDVQLFYQIALHGRRDLPLAPDARTGFEMAVLRMLAFRPAASVSAGGAAGAPASSTPSKRTPTGPPSPPSAAPRPQTRAPSSATESAGVGSGTAPLEERPADASPPPELPPAEPEERASDADGVTPTGARRPASAGDGAVDWPQVVSQLRVGGMARALAQHCDWGGRDGDRVILCIEEGHRHLVNDTMRDRLAKAVSDYFGEALRLDIQLGEVHGETPAQAHQREAEAQQQAAERSIESDPNVAAFRETFGAEVVHESVRPLD
ncbi:DNA polymerase III subunit gamma/tau [Arhodomonas sp. AD133]|uniref:DNA polymerase III subunit gamma/tau n=1 Tax=Arhodomonas sp. AD133 TaxID=3415009 RepID=UPI003EBE93D2